jgi:hypothetical protein
MPIALSTTASRTTASPAPPSEPIDVERDLVLMLTATVQVNGMSDVSRPDPRDRERDYADALRYYLTRHPRFRRIAFVENSGWPLDGLRRVAADANRHGAEVEFVSLRCNDFPRHLGKSFGEMLLVDQALRRSALLADARYVGKLTGRLFLTNLTRLMAAARGPFDLFCDDHGHGLYERLRLPARFVSLRCESRFLVFTPAAFDRLIRPRYHELDDSRGLYLEKLLHRVATARWPGLRVVNRFPIEPEFRGRAGHGNKDFGSPVELAKVRVRAALRRVLPKVHF